MFKSSLRIAAVLLSGLVLSGSAVASAGAMAPMSAGDSTTVHACVAKADRYVTNYYGRQIIVIPHGTARIVKSARVCKRWESATSWSKGGGAGTPGADGAAGGTGATGTAGASGSDGSDGHDGVDGAAGQGVTMAVLAVGDPLCATGGVTLTSEAQTVAVCDGAAGAAGSNGSDGAAGANGSDGHDGAAGAAGAAGANGSDGQDGATGAAGAAGAAGANGSDGHDGAAGAAGSNGSDGHDGATGAAGAAGANGIDGIDGIDGAAGAAGAAGSNGSDGIDGIDGAGVSVERLFVGDAVCITGGVSVTDASSTSYVCNGMPGATGSTGATGATGATGGTGATGATGGIGATGSQGAQGTIGATGKNGPRGFDGAIGPAGATGAQGIQGATGSQGPKGDPGADAPASSLIGADTGNTQAGDQRVECVLGGITLFATPSLYGQGTPANGQLLSISSNTALFALLGTTYGGDGQRTFALPDLRALAPNNMTYFICTEGIFPSSS